MHWIERTQMNDVKSEGHGKNKAMSELVQWRWIKEEGQLFGRH